MSIATYNGVTLPYALTADFSVTPVQDEVSGTDWYVSRYKLNIQALIGPDYLIAIDPTLAASDPASIMNGIIQKLQTRRKRLSFTINGVEQIPQPQQGLPGGSSVDASNGPIPQEVKYLDLTTGNFLISFSIQADYWRSVDVRTNPNGPNSPGAPVVYNRWSEQVNMDDLGMTERTRTGKFRIRSDNTLGLTADRFRTEMAVVSVPDGFLRTKANYVQSPDGLSIAYTIVDKEYFKCPPPPAFKANGTYREETTRGGAKRYAEVSITLEGDKRTNQATLVSRAQAICLLKLRNNAVFVGGLIVTPGIPFTLRDIAILEGATVEVDMYNNRVSMTMRAYAPVNRDRTNAVEAFRGGLVFTPGSDDIDNNYTPAYQNYGTAGILLQAAAYYDPSLRGVELGPRTITTPVRPFTSHGTRRVQMNQGRIPGTAGVDPEA